MATEKLNCSYGKVLGGMTWKRERITHPNRTTVSNQTKLKMYKRQAAAVRPLHIKPSKFEGERRFFSLSPTLKTNPCQRHTTRILDKSAKANAKKVFRRSEATHRAQLRELITNMPMSSNNGTKRTTVGTKEVLELEMNNSVFCGII